MNGELRKKEFEEIAQETAEVMNGVYREEMEKIKGELWHIIKIGDEANRRLEYIKFWDRYRI